jgi:hypothetical protein
MACLLAILVDAFKPEYLRFAPFLQGLALRGAAGRLREDFGFVPRASYFGGLDASTYGFTNMYAFDPLVSPFIAASMMPDVSRRLAREAGFREFVDARARQRLPAFAAAYAAASFDIVEKYAPWERGAGYESIFGKLAARGDAWYSLAWPETNRLADRSDEGIVETALAAIAPEHRLAYLHLQALDGIGHAYGPGAPEVRDAILVMDRLIERVVTRLRRARGAIDVIVYGDHGMVPVTRLVDLRARLDATGLRTGADYQIFLDSTMARFWFFHAAAKRRIVEALGQAPGGHWLSRDELEAFGIAGCARGNGDGYFLADPGVLLFPNFFQEQWPARGMHGYDPACSDNQGVVIVDTTRPGWSNLDLGTLPAAGIHSLLTLLLELDGEGHDAIAGMPRPRDCRASFTASRVPEAEAAIAKQLDLITATVLDVVPHAEAIILEGSFGRGEGSTWRDPEGRWWPVNDYDILVVSPTGDAGALRAREDALASACGLDFIHLALDNGQWRELPASIAHFDRRYGSRVLYGASDILQRLPAYAAADIPLFEGLQLLFNRSAGVLSALVNHVPQRARTARTPADYLRTQLSKALVAIGDWHLLRWQVYETSYAARLDRFLWLAPGAGLDRATIDAVATGYRVKLDASSAPSAPPLPDTADVSALLLSTLTHAAREVTGVACASLREAVSQYVAFTTRDAEGIHRDNRHTHPRIARELPVRADIGEYSIRQEIYAALPLALDAAISHPTHPKMAAAAAHHLDRVIPTPLDTAWSEVAQRTITAWFAIAL